MRLKIPDTLRGILTLILMGLNLLIWFIPVMLLTLCKLLPLTSWRDLMTRWTTASATGWVYGNRTIFNTLLNTRWEIIGLNRPAPQHWYLLIANHQSWVDILALQQVFTGKIPFLKFFIKQSLIWVPLLGQAWWALDMPFMKRYSRAQLARRPQLRGRDLDTTRRACQRFRRTPTTIFNFVEGTRLTPAKQAASASPYRHLLAPRAGGIAFVINSMGDMLQHLLDVSIVYPQGSGSFWDFCCGRIRHIIIDIRERTLENWMLQGDYLQDEHYRQQFQAWLSTLWQEKDQRIEQLLATAQAQRNTA